MRVKWIIICILLALLLVACEGENVLEATKAAPPTSMPRSTTEGTDDVFEVIPDISEPPPPRAELEFSTDFSKHSVPYSEIISGGPSKDVIPAIDNPVFISVDEAEPWLAKVEPVIFVQVGEDARAYPIQILIWHEIVNDTIGGLPLTVTFCPLCNTGIAFERTVDGRELDFGTTGRLRNSNLIMYDRQTESWWQQGTGEAIVGEYLGTTLKMFPVSIISWGDFFAAFPDGKVLSRDTGYNRDYGRNPYVGYDDINNSPFLFKGEIPPGQLAAMERVLALELNGEAVAYSFTTLREMRVIHDQVGGEEVVIFWAEGTASALDMPNVSSGRDVGSANAFSPVLDGKRLTFSEQGDVFFEDENTGSIWNILGKSVDGPLEGESLNPLTAVNHFWFDWVAFKPETKIYQP